MNLTKSSTVALIGLFIVLAALLVSIVGYAEASSLVDGPVDKRKWISEQGGNLAAFGVGASVLVRAWLLRESDRGSTPG